MARIDYRVRIHGRTDDGAVIDLAQRLQEIDAKAIAAGLESSVDLGGVVLPAPVVKPVVEPVVAKVAAPVSKPKRK
jgi:hypothetical protein